MSDAPKRIWLPPEHAEDAAPADNGYGMVEYVRADIEDELLAALSKLNFWINQGDFSRMPMAAIVDMSGDIRAATAAIAKARGQS